METLYAIDLRIFQAINAGMSHPAFDFIVKIFVSKVFFFSVFAIGLAFTFTFGGAKTKGVVVAALAAFVLSDVCVYLLKHVVGRTRPCHVVAGVKLLIACPDSFSFPSRHTAGAFAITTVLSVSFVRYSPVFAAFAIFTGFSRVYSGAHYPSDVFFGAIIGAATGIAAHYYFCRKEAAMRVLAALCGKCKV